MKKKNKFFFIDILYYFMEIFQESKSNYKKLNVHRLVRMTRRLSVDSGDNTINLWEKHSGKILKTFEGTKMR